MFSNVSNFFAMYLSMCLFIKVINFKYFLKSKLCPLMNVDFNKDYLKEKGNCEQICRSTKKGK